MSKITVKELEALTVPDHGRVFHEDGGLTGKVHAGVRGITVLFRYECQAGRERIANQTVKDLFDVWIADGVARKDDNAELKRLFNKDILPVISKKPLCGLTDKDILAMLRKQMKRGVIRLAVTTYKGISQMLSWGEKRQPWRGLLARGVLRQTR